MKDGRALRIKRGRTRRPSSLAKGRPAADYSGEVQRALVGQWGSMIEDLEVLRPLRGLAEAKPVHHLLGDARHLGRLALPGGGSAFPDAWASLSLFSPPYLNFIDYTELYKLELWLMEFVQDQESFRQTRLGTLRSHPSVRFPSRSYFQDQDGQVIDLIRGITSWMSDHAARAEVGPIIAQYFEDMFQVLREQARIVAPDGVAVCVVANSTFSRRTMGENGVREELWRLPLLTDVILGQLGKLAGFSDVEVRQARNLRPKNVRGGTARESLVVFRKSE
jgi:hypothetical protein